MGKALKKRCVVLQNATLVEDWHVYGIAWDEDSLYTYLDDDSNRILGRQISFFWRQFVLKGRTFAKIGSGQTCGCRENLKTRTVFSQS
jgi:hypothetical protein